jgi:hypothetical protein
MANCSVCVKKINQNALKIKCVECTNIFHAQCVRMSKADIETLTSEGLVWRCDPCAATRRKSMRLESAATQGGLTIEDVMKVLKEIQEDQAKTARDFNSAHESLQEQLAQTTDAVKEQTAKNEELLKKLEEVVSENIQLRKRVESLEAKLDECEQYSRRNTIEIHGIPAQPNETQEDVMELVKKVGTGLGVEINDLMIDVCHRLPNRNSEKPPVLVVKFVRRIDKDKLLEKRRARKGDFSTRHMGLATDNPVFLNEALTTMRRRLFLQAREVKKRLKYDYLWHRGGKIFMRKKNGERVVVISCQADLDKLE